MNLHWQFQIFRIIALLRRRPKTNFDTRFKIHFLQYSPNIFENMIDLMTNYIYFSLLVHLKCSFFKQKVLDSFMIFSILPSILRFCWRFMILQSDSNDSFDSVVIFGFINESGKILDSNTTILRDSGQGVRRLYGTQLWPSSVFIFTFKCQFLYVVIEPSFSFMMEINKWKEV